MAKRQKILQLIASSHGGGATHVLDLATLLPKDQFAVTVALPEDGGNVSPDNLKMAGATVVPLAIRSGFKLSELKKVWSLLKNGRFEILHVHGARAGLYGRLAALMLRQRPHIIFSVHGFATPYYGFPKKQLYLILERLFQSITTHTICVAKAEQTLFLAHTHLKKQKTSIIHPGIPLDRFDKNGIDPNRIRHALGLDELPVILTVCRLNIPRDFETLLTAVSLTQKAIPTVQLLIVGDGPLRDTIEAKIKALNLQANVHLLGFRQNIPALLAAADIYTLTSNGWEGFPISTLEAQAMGCPVVVSNAGGAAEAVLHEQTGIVVPKQNANALANALITLLNDDALKQKFGENGRRRAKASLSRENMVEKITAVYAKGTR